MNKGALESGRPWLGSLGLLAILFARTSGAASPDQAKVAHLTVHAEQDGPKISPLLYGVFFEEINRAGEGGLWAEMIQNRSFEDDRKEPAAWKFSGPVKASLDRQRPLHRQNPTSLYLEFSGSDGFAYALQTSANLINWIDVSTNYPAQGYFRAPISPLPSSQGQYYRSVLLP